MEVIVGYEEDTTTKPKLNKFFLSLISHYALEQKLWLGYSLDEFKKYNIINALFFKLQKKHWHLDHRVVAKDSSF